MESNIQPSPMCDTPGLKPLAVRNSVSLQTDWRQEQGRAGVTMGRVGRKGVWWLHAGITGRQRAIQFQSFHQKPGGKCKSPAD